MATRNKYKNRNPKQGLILLIVLGMLAMFTLLAVTYVVTAGSSRQGSLALAVKARGGNLSIKGTARNVIKDVIRGTNNQKSPFYKTSLLEDVFGPNPIKTQFGPFHQVTNSVRRFYTPATNVNFVKLSVNPAAQLNGPLSPFENEYNSRILTVQEGPLAGQSFRILKYVGYVKDGIEGSLLYGTAPDPNIDLTPWSNPAYVDNLPLNGHVASDIEYSILIDLNEVVGAEFVGEYTDNNGTVKSISQSLDKWLTAPFSINHLFYFKSTALSVAPTTNTMVGYKFLINDAPFTNAGIGMEDIAAIGTTPIPGYGNLDSRRLMKVAVPTTPPTPPAIRTGVTPAILTHYDYLQDPNIMATNPADGTIGVDGIGNTTRDWTTSSAFTQFAMNGASNEGYDVPGYQDPFLANQGFAGGVQTIKPSYHDPAVINYLSHLFGSPSSLSYAQVQDLLRLIDASSARVLSYLNKNVGFRENDPNATALRLPQSFTWSSPPTGAEIGMLQTYVYNQIIGLPKTIGGVTINEWDVDNDGDGIADSVWIDPGMQVVFSPDGRRLRPLAAILIEDLDGRVNLNTAGDRVQGNMGHNAAFNVGYDVTTDTSFKRPSQIVPQGFGYGPAEISLTSLFGMSASLLAPSGSNYDPPPIVPSHYGNRFSFFDELVGARRSTGRPIVFPFIHDRVPGIPRVAAYPSLSTLTEREFHVASQHNHLPGMPLSRRSTFGMSFDLNGNPRFVNPGIVDGNPYGVTNASPAAFANETLNDKYEIAAMETPISDDPLSLFDLETLLRRFDEDAASLSPRLRDKLLTNPAYSIMDAVNREITVRSAELRYPNLVSAQKTMNTTATGLTIAGQSPGSGTPSYLRYIKLLHSQRYRNQSFPADPTTDDPEISYAALAELFPVDFAKGLRMDLNRPFGNGYDDVTTDVITGVVLPPNNQVDEPYEIENAAQLESFPTGPAVVTAAGAYTREIKPSARKLTAKNTDSNVSANPFPSQTRGRLGSRQILARNLYCLAQLIIPRDFNFPGMSVMPAPTTLARARIRATAIAQWAVNVVDFRDADAAMTRFEFDILPFGSNIGAGANFGSGTGGGLPAKGAYWAPDRIQHFGNKDYVGVVWGMEMPELLLTETLAMHDKRLKDTDMDTSGASTVSTTADTDLDQWRFPLASLFLELYNPRTTDVATNTFLPGAPSSLYTAGMGLQLDKMAPANATWGSQPVWRIAISPMYPVPSATPTIPNTQHPQARLTATTPAPADKSFETVTHQWSTEGVPGGTAPETALTGVADIDRSNVALLNIEQHIGSGLRYDQADGATAPTIMPPPIDQPGPPMTAEAGFERFVWFTGTAPGAMQMIPDVIPSIRTAGLQSASVFSSTTASTTLAGGSYLVIGPRAVTEFGSLTHNPFTGYTYPSILTSLAMATPGNRPVFSPSFQHISLSTGVPTSGSISTTLLNNVNANLPWMSRVKPATAMICTTAAPAMPAAWGTAFPSGVGLNVSFPPPSAGLTIWTNAPTTQLNSADVGGAGGRPAGSAGFGSPSMPPDSWINVSAPSNTLPDSPLDDSNPLLIGRLNTGTYENVRAAYLQRLADPDFAYDPVTNPYITVDWMSIDLTVFNGEAPFPGTPGADPNDAVPAAPNLVRFQSRYKNGALSPLVASHDVAANKGISAYSPVTSMLRGTVAQTTLPTSITANTVASNPEAYFMHQLGFDRLVPSSRWTGVAPAPAELGNSASTFGYCNVGYYLSPTDPLPTIASMSSSAASTWDSYDGFGPPSDIAPPLYQGAPTRIAGLTWFNRPFASPYELTMVPLTGPGQFGLHHSACLTVYNREVNGFVPSYQTTNAWNVDLATTATPPATPPSLTSYWAKPEALPTTTLLFAVTLAP